MVLGVQDSFPLDDRTAVSKAFPLYVNDYRLTRTLHSNAHYVCMCICINSHPYLLYTCHLYSYVFSVTCFAFPYVSVHVFSRNPSICVSFHISLFIPFLVSLQYSPFFFPPSSKLTLAGGEHQHTPETHQILTFLELFTYLLIQYFVLFSSYVWRPYFVFVR